MRMKIISNVKKSALRDSLENKDLTFIDKRI